MKVDFKYKLDDIVETPISDAGGIITMLGFDDGGITYFVVTNDKGLSDRWWKEKLLTTSELVTEPDV